MMRTSSQSGSVKCINGIKTLSTFYIIFGHTYYSQVVSENTNLNEVPKVSMYKHAISHYIYFICKNISLLPLLLTTESYNVTFIVSKDARSMAVPADTEREYSYRHVFLTERHFAGLHRTVEEGKIKLRQTDSNREALRLELHSSLHKACRKINFSWTTISIFNLIIWATRNVICFSNINAIYFYFLNIGDFSFRLTPPYAMMIGFYATLFNKLDSGPHWGSVDLSRTQCRENWWTNLLYINNYINVPNMVSRNISILLSFTFFL